MIQQTTEFPMMFEEVNTEEIIAMKTTTKSDIAQRTL